MVNALLVPFDEPSHIEAMFVLGSRLRSRGHDVALYGHPQRAMHDPPTMPVIRPTRWSRGRDVPADVLALKDPCAIYRYLFLGSVRDMEADVTEAAEAIGATTVISDVFMPGAGLAAARLGMRWVSLACTPIPAMDSYRSMMPAHALSCFEASSGPSAPDSRVPAHGGATAENSLATENGSARKDNLLGRISPWLHLIPSTPTFAGHRPCLPRHVGLVGPLTPPPGGTAASPDDAVGLGHHVPVQADAIGLSCRVPCRHGARATAGHPTVAVTTSSAGRGSLGAHAHPQDRYLRLVVAALATMRVSAVVTLPADGKPFALGSAPGNVRYAGPLPHEELFGQCDLVITHGGWGTVGRALRRGLPLILAPFIHDQFYIASRCQELGIGLALDPLAMTVAEVREAIGEVCGSPAYRAAAAEVAAEIATAESRDVCSSLIESLLHAKG